MNKLLCSLSAHLSLLVATCLLFCKAWAGRAILFIAIILVATGCFRKFYDSGTERMLTANRFQMLKEADKFFIVHGSNWDIGLRAPEIVNNRIVAEVQGVPFQHTQEYFADSIRPNPFQTKYKNAVLAEVHLYTLLDKSIVFKENNRIEMLLSDLYRVDVYEFDFARTSKSTVRSVVGLVTAGIVLGVIIGEASKEPEPAPPPPPQGECGCPEVYTISAGEQKFENAIFSGAMYSNLERSDYLTIDNVQPINNELGFMLRGHQDEIQQINSIELLRVSHNANSRVIADKHGKLWSIATPQAPLSAVNASGRNVTQALLQADDIIVGFDDMHVRDQQPNVELMFEVPKGAQSARLVVRGRNSGWAAMLSEEYRLLFGEDYFRYRNVLEKLSPEAMEKQVLEQGLPLKVYVSGGKQWQYAGYLPLVGSLAFRDQVIDIDLSKVNGDKVNIKLETAFKFWDIDEVYIDYTHDNVAVTAMPLAKATLNDKDIMNKISIADKDYLELTNTESVDVSFKVPDTTSLPGVTYILKTKGYYHANTEYPVPSNKARLYKFRKPGEFDRFSKELYQKQQELSALSKN